MNRVQVEISEIVLHSIIEARLDGTPPHMITDPKDPGVGFVRLDHAVTVLLLEMRKHKREHFVGMCYNGPDTAVLTIEHAGGEGYYVHWYYDYAEGTIWCDETDLGDETHFSWHIEILANGGFEITQDTAEGAAATGAENLAMLDTEIATRQEETQAQQMTEEPRVRYRLRMGSEEL